MLVRSPGQPPRPAPYGASNPAFTRSSITHVEGPVTSVGKTEFAARPATGSVQMQGTMANLGSTSRAMNPMPPPAHGPSVLRSQGTFAPLVNPLFASTSHQFPSSFHQQGPVAQLLSAVPQTLGSQDRYPTYYPPQQASQSHQSSAPTNVNTWQQPLTVPNGAPHLSSSLGPTNGLPQRSSAPPMSSYPEDFGYVGAGLAVPVAPQSPNHLPVIPYRLAATATPAGAQPFADDTITAPPFRPSFPASSVPPASQAEGPQSPPSPPPKSMR